MPSSDQDEDNETLLHVHDLPQLWQRPAARDLIATLHELTLTPSTFQNNEENRRGRCRAIGESGVPGYLTSIIASKLGWIVDTDQRESIWELASLRLSERSGRSAMPAMTRTFAINDELSIRLHEPSLFGDNLGLKTWASSLLLSQQLSRLSKHLPNTTRVLELGAGTGLVGISAACLWHTSVLLTDLPEIVPNLEHNLDLNEEIVSRCAGLVAAEVLDWSDATRIPVNDEDRYAIIIAADPIYSPDHPSMLVNTISRWLKQGGDARVLIELPKRQHYTHERATLTDLMQRAGLEVLVSGVETGFDDWLDDAGKQASVECEYSVWSRTA